MDFSKIFDYVPPRAFKDIIKNLQGRNAEVVDENEDLFSEAEKLKKRNQELEDQIRILNCLEYGSEFLIRHSSARKILESHLNSYDCISQSEVKGSEEVYITNKWTDNRGKSLRIKSTDGKYERIAKLSYQFVPISIEINLDGTI